MGLKMGMVYMGIVFSNSLLLGWMLEGCVEYVTLLHYKFFYYHYYHIHINFAKCADISVILEFFCDSLSVIKNK